MSKPAVFFDRDNTLVQCDEYLSDPAAVIAISGAAQAVARAHEMGFAVITFSDQPGVARGLFTERDVAAVNQRMDQILRKQDPQAIIDRHEFCPFHPDAKLGIYKRTTMLNKPRPGMLLRAAKALDLDLARSWVIGDGPLDIQAGHAAGCRTILVNDPSLENSDSSKPSTVDPDETVSSLAEAMDVIEAAGGPSPPEDIAPITVTAESHEEEPDPPKPAAKTTASSPAPKKSSPSIVPAPPPTPIAVPAPLRITPPPAEPDPDPIPESVEPPPPAPAIPSPIVLVETPTPIYEEQPPPPAPAPAPAPSLTNYHPRAQLPPVPEPAYTLAAESPLPQPPPPRLDLGRLEQLSYEILLELRDPQRTVKRFSISRLFAGLIQALALAAFALAAAAWYFHRPISEVTLIAIAALFLQTLTASLLLMARDR